MYTPESNRTIHCDLNRNELEKICNRCKCLFFQFISIEIKYRLITEAAIHR